MSHPARMAFGARIRELRHAAGWSLDGLRDALTEQGVRFNSSQISKIERGVRPTSVEEVHALAAAFRLSSPADLLDYRGMSADQKAVIRASMRAAGLQMKRVELERELAAVDEDIKSLDEGRKP